MIFNRVIGICGPLPEWMFKEGRLINQFFTKEKLLYQEVKNIIFLQFLKVFEDGGEAS